MAKTLEKSCQQISQALVSQWVSCEMSRLILKLRIFKANQLRDDFKYIFIIVKIILIISVSAGAAVFLQPLLGILQARIPTISTWIQI